MDNIKLWFRERKAVYSTLALFYGGNLKTGLNILENTDLLEKLTKWKSNLAVPRGAEMISSEINRNNLNSKYREELWEDYYRLFLGPGRILAASWESVYENKDRLIFGKSELSVRRFYHEFGLEVNPKEAADHLHFELSFMARLCDFGLRGDLQNITRILEAMEKFLKDHLCRWISTWKDSVKLHAETGFWVEFSNMTEGWLMGNLQEIEKLKR
ncbi:TorD/DmsD family molecular chaperone [Clostridium luticellarii]|jgi:TorA maturation chaperone TorD|uniref:Chaperone protein TorD n=1 Tax=Clostridium luticellarii TaxID=1691940 RepID=A0A2T0BN32_9CLOT|nr:molecular chaperone TorD family protein [Clostridium luticellarii]MCI1945149.1 molecular chaperone TorD family protein [Clostridium luticellarii]MCI1968538.1 molecular chaperone TorD family protein [Clostridium luticellarii]MCI1995991.1 molecular chaperone TorD family protein [Clostridium luticellarii]MCI2041233.1 molecular chaperone TorD family protein [Clostridium luticellarii]PRR85277.1 chaperone protein TorD [Clostridium luticellarii]